MNPFRDHARVAWVIAAVFGGAPGPTSALALATGDTPFVTREHLKPDEQVFRIAQYGMSERRMPRPPGVTEWFGQTPTPVHRLSDNPTPPAAPKFRPRRSTKCPARSCRAMKRSAHRHQRYPRQSLEAGARHGARAAAAALGNGSRHVEI